MAKALGSPFWLLVVWLVVGATTLSGALCYGELAGRFPSAGGAYVYLKESYGPHGSRFLIWLDVPARYGPGNYRVAGVRPCRYFAYYIVPLPPLLD